MEELIGEEHQQRGDRLKQDAVSDVTRKTRRMNTQLKRLNDFSCTTVSQLYRPITDPEAYNILINNI